MRARTHCCDYAYCSQFALNVLYSLFTCNEHVHSPVPQSSSIPGQSTETGERHTAQPHPPPLPGESCSLNTHLQTTTSSQTGVVSSLFTDETLYMCEVVLCSVVMTSCNGIVSSGQPPSLPELLRLKVPQEVGPNYSTFGIFLLDDQTGSRVNTIEHDCNWQSGPIIRKILQEWLEGKGLPVTWASLVQTLRDTGLPVLADQIQASKMAP